MSGLPQGNRNGREEHAGSGTSGDGASGDVTHSVAGSGADPGDDPSRRSPSGPSWGHLTLHGEIGRGAFGRVYRAWDPVLDRDVALKVIQVPDTDPHAAAALLREGRMLARIRHPNIVTVYGAQQVGSEIGIWMELVRGRSLADVVHHDGPMSADEAAVVASALCRALAAVHGEGLVHRDVKAQNVMREAGGRIVLMDFGTGRELARAAAGDVAGTPLYMAPEVLAGRPASPVSDIYSLGVLLFYLVTGEHPVQGRSMVELVVEHGLGHRRLLADRRADLPDGFLRVVERALANVPADRCQSAGAMLRDLLTIPSGTGTLVTLDAPPQPAAPVRETGGAAGVPAARRGGSEGLRSWASRAALASVGGVLALTAIGWLTTNAFNNTLGRGQEFAPESLRDLAVWGVRALIAPAVYMALAAAPVALVQMAWRMVATVSGRFSTWSLVFRQRLARWTARVDQPGVLAQVVATAEAVALAAVLWHFASLISAVMDFVSTADGAAIAPLGPGNRPQQLVFRLVLSLLSLVFGAAWIWIWKRRATSPTPGSSLGFTVGAVLSLLLVLLLVTPYRLFTHSEFERVDFAGQRCYALGTRGGEVLLYCPDATPPRHRQVRSDTPQLQRTNIIESVFAPARGAPAVR